MLRILNITRNRRIAHLRDGRFIRLYGPGRHRLFVAFGVHEFLEFDTVAAPTPLPIDDPLPAELPGARVICVGPFENLAVVRNGVVQAVLAAGRYRLWDGPSELVLHRFDVRSEPQPLSDGDPLLMVPDNLVIGAVADAASAVVLLRVGQPVRALASGRYRVWWAGEWRLRAVPLHLRDLDLALQDLLTADGVTVRVKPVARVRVTDPVTWLQADKPDAQAYTAVQLALREVVSGRTLESLLADRSALSGELAERAALHLPDVGLALKVASVKEIVLPGDVKALFGRVTLARKEAEALAIKRREEVAQTRQLANTAKLLASNPVLLRLRELEALTELAGRIDKLTVVGGEDLLRQIRLPSVEA